MTSNASTTETKGKFRKDVYERSLKAVRTQNSARPVYRAVGENPRESTWDRDSVVEDSKGTSISY
jgi:hypothetical protein